MAAIENNNDIFSEKNLEDLLEKTAKTALTRVKIYLSNKIGNFKKCLDIYLKEFKGEEQIILTYDYINGELVKFKNDKIQYQKIKEYILERITEIASLSIERLMELTDNYFNSNYAEILFRINNDSVKLKYLEEIILKYKEEDLNPDEPATLEYQKILKLHIDLLCNLKYYDQILPNLKLRNHYPINYCLEKCRKLNIYDASIYLERKSGNVEGAIKLVNLLTKEEFYKIKSFYQDNYDIIKLFKEEENSDEEEIVNELIENEEEMNKDKIRSKEEEILYQKKLLVRKQDKLLKLGIEICDSCSQSIFKDEANKEELNIKNSKEESKKNLSYQIRPKEELKKYWQSLISVYYELIKEIKSEIKDKKIKLELGEYLKKELENRAGEITEKMNSYFDLNTVLSSISQIQGESFDSKEYKSLLKRLLFSGEYFNRILQSANSLLRANVLDTKKEFVINATLGKHFDFIKCDFCGKEFKKKDKNEIVAFNCGHKYHDNCCIFINKEKSCRKCLNYEYNNEEIFVKEESEIIIREKEDKKLKPANKKPNVSGIKTKADLIKSKRLKVLNDINDNYFELSKMFESDH